MVQNIAEEIKQTEEKARLMIHDAKADMLRDLANTRLQVEESIKKARQETHRNFREQIRKTEEEADALAAEVLAKGQKDAEEFIGKHKDRIDSVAEWIAEEVMAHYVGNPG